MTVDCAGRHVCEPDGWPSSIDDRWTCPECGNNYRAFRPSESPHVPERFKASIPADSFGWRGWKGEDGPELDWKP